MTETAKPIIQYLKEYKITDNLSVKLRYDKPTVRGGIVTSRSKKTVVIVDGKEIAQCMFLMLNIPLDETNDTFDYVNIDEMAGNYSADLERNRDKYGLTAEEEFWGHCSNLEAWVENDYNPNLLRSNLSVPLLTKLAHTDIKIFDSLLYHLDDMWKAYKTIERKIFVFDTYSQMIYRLFLHYNIKIMDVYKTNAFLKCLVEITAINRYNYLGKRLVKYVNRVWANSDINRFLRKFDYLSKQLRRTTFILNKQIVAKEQESFIRKRNYWERKIWGSGKKNLEYRRWLRNLRNHEVSVVSDELGYIPYLWSMNGHPDRDYPKWHDLVEYSLRCGGGAKMIVDAYLAEGITHYYYLNWAHTFCNGWSGSHTLRRVIVRYKDGNFAIRHLIN